MTHTIIDSMFHVVVATDNSAPSKKAIFYAFQLCRHMNIPYLIKVVYVTALNKPSILPYLDHLEKSFNIEIQEKAEQDLEELQEFLNDTGEGMRYELVPLEGCQEVEKVLMQYVHEQTTPVNMLIVGTRNLNGMAKLVLGSVSEHILHQAPCPVVVVKD